MPGTTRQRVAALVAGLLIVLSLGLPWTPDTSQYVPGWMSPSICMPSTDGTIWCSGGFVSPGYMIGSSAASGASSIARVFLVGALVLIVVAGVRRESRWLSVAGGGLILSLLLVGLAFLGGQVAAVGAAILLLYAGLSAADEPARG